MGITSALLRDDSEAGTSAPNPRPTTSPSTTGRKLGPVFQSPRCEREHPPTSRTFPSPRPTRVPEVPAPLPRPGCDRSPRGSGHDPHGHHYRCPSALRRLDSEEGAGWSTAIPRWVDGWQAAARKRYASARRSWAGPRRTWRRAPETGRPSTQRMRGAGDGLGPARAAPPGPGLSRRAAGGTGERRPQPGVEPGPMTQ